MKKSHSIDMCNGSLADKILLFALPLMASSLLQLLFNAADVVVVGRFAGKEALAAVGSNTSLINLTINLFVGLSVGTNVVVSRDLGAGRYDNVGRSVHTAMTLALASGIGMMIFGVVMVRQLLEWMSSPTDVIDLATVYLRIYFLGMPANLVYNFGAAILRAQGDTQRPLYFLTFAGVVNVLLNLVFVIALQMDVAGVALATIIAQFVSAFLCLRRLTRMKDVLDLNVHTLKPHMDLAKDLVKLGLPSGLSQAIFSMAAIVVQSLTNSFGAMIIAVNTVVMRVDGFAMMPNMTFGQAMSVYTGQNVGAGKLDRVVQGRKQGTAMAVGLACAITACLLLFGRHLFALFTDTEELIVLAGRMMRIMAAGYIAIAVSQVLGGVMRGAGDTVTPMWISLFTTIFMRVPVAYALAYLTRCEAWPNGRPEALSVSLLVPWVMGAVLSYIAFRRGSWRKRLPQMMNT